MALKKYKNIIVEIYDRVALIKLNRPNALNALSKELILDLNDALNESLISGAAVDVFSKEPAKENILFNNPKVIVTPHIAASTTEASIVVAEMVANQISDFLLKGIKLNTV